MRLCELEALGARVVRVRAELVEANVAAALRVIRMGLWPEVREMIVPGPDGSEAR